jgi:methyl-accepting chemotaxis protein
VSGAITLIMQKIDGIITGETVKSRRTIFYVEKGFQKSFALFFLVLVSVLVVSSGAVLFLLINNVLEQNMYTSHPTVRNMSEIFMPNLIYYFIEITVIAMIVVIFAVDRMLKKTARSLGIYERIAERLAQLDLKKAAAVEADHFFSLHEQYMEFIGKMSADVVLLREKTTRIGCLIHSLEEDNMTKEQNATLWQEMAKLKAEIELKLMAYKLDRG